MHWYKTIATDELKAYYPEKAGEIDRAIHLLPADGLQPMFDLPARNRQDGYKEPALSGEALQLFDPRTKDVIVVESWYRVWQWEWVLLDKRLNRMTPIPEEMLAVARQLGEADPMVTVIRKPRREYAMCTHMPATKTYLAGGQPFENDKDWHPFVQFIAYREGDELLGMVRNLKDMQRDVNKRRSALADAAARQRYKYFVHRGSLDNPEALEDDSKDVFYLRNPSLQGFKEVAPPAWPEWLYRLDEKAKAEIRETSLINAPMQGKETAQSGIAIAQLQQQGQIGTAPVFRNYRRSRHLMARRFGKRVQQCYTAEKTLRLDMGAGQTAWVTINQRIVTDDGTSQVEREIPSLKWDVEMVDSPMTPTARVGHLVMLLEIMSKLPPEYGEAMADIVFEFADPPNRDEIIRRIQMIQEQKGLRPAPQEAPPAPAAPAGGNGRPPGVPGGPVASPMTPPGPTTPRPGVAPGLVPRLLQGPPGMQAGMANRPLSDTLRATGMGQGALL